MKWKKEDNRKKRKERIPAPEEMRRQVKWESFQNLTPNFHDDDNGRKMMMMMMKTWRSQIRGKEKRTDNYCQCNILPLSALLLSLHFILWLFLFSPSLLLLSHDTIRIVMTFFLTDANCTLDLEWWKSKKNRMWFAVYKGERKSLQVETHIGIHGVQWIKY